MIGSHIRGQMGTTGSIRPGTLLLIQPFPCNSDAMWISLILIRADGVRGDRYPWPRVVAGPEVPRRRLSAVFTRPTCENACGKFPSILSRTGSYDSESRP